LQLFFEEFFEEVKYADSLVYSFPPRVCYRTRNACSISVVSLSADFRIAMYVMVFQLFYLECDKNYISYLM